MKLVVRFVKGGLEVVEQTNPDTVLLDIAMPGMSGYELAWLIRRSIWGKRINVIAVTANDSQEHRTRCYDAGIDHHLVKPLNWDLLDALFAGLPQLPRVDS